jgi:WD40 repeat protein
MSVHGLQFSPDKRWLVADWGIVDEVDALGHTKHVIELVTLGTDGWRSEGEIYRGRNLSVKISPDSQFVVVGDESGIVKLWSLRADGVASSVRQLQSIGNQVFEAQFSHDGRWLAARTKDGVRVWEVADTNPNASFWLPDTEEKDIVVFGPFGFSPDDRWLVIGDRIFPFDLDLLVAEARNRAGRDMTRQERRELEIE